MAASAEPTAPPPPAWTPAALAEEQVFPVMEAAFHRALGTHFAVLEVSPSSMAPPAVWEQQETEALEEAEEGGTAVEVGVDTCLLYTSPSPRDRQKSRMPSSA